MEYPKLLIASDGKHTIALVNGVFLGPKIRHLEFLSDATDGIPKASIRLLDVDMESLHMGCGVEKFNEALQLLAKE